MAMLLKYDIDTTPGVTAYTSGSEEMATLFVLSIIAEGYREEPKYLNAIKKLCQEKVELNMVIHLLNRQYLFQANSAGHSNPTKRLEALLEWKANHPAVPGYKNKDEYWLICDRDDGSFTIQQYDEVLKKCEQENIHFIVSNPAFQLWLLLHFTDDLSAFQLNQYSNSKDCLYKGVIPAIQSFVPVYKHGTLTINHFQPYFRDAIINSGNYCFDAVSLKTTIGTNFKTLLERIESLAGTSIF